MTAVLSRPRAREPRSHQLMFYDRFVEPILDGSKRQTLRDNSKRGIRPGDLLRLRSWVGVPYRRGSSHRDLGTGLVESVVQVLVGINFASKKLRVRLYHPGVGLLELTGPEASQFVRDDGFADVDDFLAYYESQKKDFFSGDLIKWRPVATPGSTEVKTNVANL